MSARLGLTWELMHHLDELNVDAIGCDNQQICNAYIGDTPCDQALPIVCVSQTNFTRPPYNPTLKTGSAMSIEFYNGWSGGMFVATEPIIGTSILSQVHANKICSDKFGKEFIAAQHHLGRYVNGMSDTSYFYSTWSLNTSEGGWNLYGYGNLPKNTRFWVFIRDQRANCWN